MSPVLSVATAGGVASLMQRRYADRSRATRVTAILATIMAALVTVGAGMAGAADASSVARRFDDGLDSRYSAYRLSNAASSVGYASDRYLYGRHVDDVWTDGLTDHVVGLFGHANAGIFQTQEGATDAGDSILAAGTTTDAVSPYANLRFLSEYWPYTDVDDMRLLILAGCYTSQSSAWGDFNKVAVSRGIDSVISFTDLVYYPQTSAGTALGSTNYSGNYFWDRFSTYVAGGKTIATALSYARSDLVAKEGNSGGWYRYVIRGAVTNPSAMKLTPAGSGTPWNSQPLATEAYASFAELTPTSTATSTGPDGTPITTVITAEGVEYRALSDGRVFDAVATPSTSGDPTLTHSEARDTALRFAHTNVSGFSAEWAPIADEPISHVEDDLVHLFRWRPVEAGQAAAREVTIEVDRRTGAVVYFSATRGQATTAGFPISESEAIDIARRVIGDDRGTATAEADTWHTSRWIVTVNRGPAGRPEAQVPDSDRIEINARTGEVLSRVTA